MTREPGDLPPGSHARAQQAGCPDVAGPVAPNREAVRGQRRQFAVTGCCKPHWDLRVADLVRLGAERLGQEARAAEEGVIARFELGARRARRWSTLSGGERARVLLAMVLAVDPPALLADEPAASLDIRHRMDVVQALVARATDRLSVVVMHDLDLTFRFFDKVIVMDAGRIVAHGHARDIFDDQRLDAASGVKFERLTTARDRLLRPV